MRKVSVKQARELIRKKMRSLPRDETYKLLELQMIVDAVEEDDDDSLFLSEEEWQMLK
jgi:hypothetical protein